MECLCRKYFYGINFYAHTNLSPSQDVKLLRRTMYAVPADFTSLSMNVNLQHQCNTADSPSGRKTTQVQSLLLPFSPSFPQPLSHLSCPAAAYLDKLDRPQNIIFKKFLAQQSTNWVLSIEVPVNSKIRHRYVL